jgi:hypothetical protein
MKIAVCLSGQPRGIPLSLDQLKNNILTPNEIVDTFVHTWYHPDWDNVPFDSAQPGQEDGRLGKWKPKTDQIIKESLNPLKITIEKPNNFAEFLDLLGQPSAVQTKMASIFYGMWKANELKKEYENEHNFKYDIVLRVRFDLFYNHPLLLKEFMANNSNDGIFLSYKFQHDRQNDSYPISIGGTYSSMADTFAFGSSKNMDTFCSVYPNFREIHSKIWPHVYGEAYLGYQVRGINKIPINMIPFEYDILHRVINMNNI